MAVNEVASEIGIKVGTETTINHWFEVNPDAEIIDIKFSCDPEGNDMLCVIYRREG
ncbi:hypothetical protein SAMN05518684_106233 [Salipaludibacillus aurantiacus]|uniref:Uncharacterized protein n=1 Tax=Salipaludibacillus aurantiacus TaxID=1601833 RepID=A0A1H9U1G1_9BACI|nr:hypothetical protein SAMN05518684_106233 [Salipaludibacillus aurantiacus]